MIKQTLIILALTGLVCSCKPKTTLFTLLPGDETGIRFVNRVPENDSVNILDLENIFNGAGIGIGDFNNDGLQDIYFAANNSSNKLYLNKGGLRFEDITDQAGVDGQGRWCRGVSVVDINADGRLDLYVCGSLAKESKRRENLLYINAGTNEKGIPGFKNMAAEYGLADTVHSTMAAFFDYDNDGDLDMYLLVNEIRKGEFPGNFRPVLRNREHPNSDKLFRNSWNDSLGHPVFTDISTIAGITTEGYGHGVNIVDINRDGWKDIYVTNDFIGENQLLINNHDGTFSDQVKAYFKHTSENSMGQDIIDINNDGLADVIELDMNPEDNFRKKMMMNPLTYQRYQNNEFYGFQHQYVRNVLQINQGPRVLENDSVGDPVFSDIAFYSGIAETDWSWTPAVIDFDNDGYRDIIITNGFPKDVTDHDFVAYRSRAYQIAAKSDLLEQIPRVKISNYAYKNNGDLTFKNVTRDWGMYRPSFSNAAAYADLDNDGDLDFVVSNIDDEAFLYRNNSRQDRKANNYLHVQLVGSRLNRNGIGAWVELYYDGKKQVYENTPFRGYLSSIQNFAHFGLDSATIVDSVIVRWPELKMQVFQHVKPNQVLNVDFKDATLDYSFVADSKVAHPLFSEITDALNIHYLHKERDFIDFNVQKLLPHKLSEYGPALAAGDIDGNGLDDIVIGGSFFYDTQIFLQQKNGQFTSKRLQGKGDSIPAKNHEDLGICLFDADNDEDLDMYIASGGYEMEHNTAAYQDRFYINDGKGNFQLDTLALPRNFASKSCVRAADFDHDGDLDLFVAGRVDPRFYPKPVSSFIYRNDSKNGKARFFDVTNSVAPALVNVGLICDGLWTDFDNDGWQDLVLAGEWMPIKFLRNENGRFTDISANTGIAEQTGWWGSLVPGDFDNDGDIDYVAGNLGLNSFYRASGKFPVKIYAKDFNGDGSYDAIPSVFLPASQQDTTRKEFPAHLRDEVIKQIIGFRAKFPHYHFYAIATFDYLFTSAELKDALVYQARHFANSLIRNLGNGRFELIDLPPSAQYACINGMVAEDFNRDGNLDLLIAGNDYSTEVSIGRYDACNGLVLLGDGNGSFRSMSIMESGWFVPGNARSVIRLRHSGGNVMMAVSQNRGAIKVCKWNEKSIIVPLGKLDISALVKYKNGKVQRREINYGSSFLSQSAHFLILDGDILSVEINDGKKNSRTVYP